MKKGDKIIWDSGCGYDIGIFEEDQTIYNTQTITLNSGKAYGSKIAIPSYELFLYTKELQKKMTEKYGYDFSFSETF